MSSGSQVSAATHPSVGCFPGITDHRGHFHRLFRSGVLLLDRTLRRALGIYEFSTSPECLLRIAIAKAQRDPNVPGGCCLRPSDSLIDLHFWNEHFEHLLARKASCARARFICRHLQLSMSLLAAYLVAHPEISAPIIHARLVVPLRGRFANLKAIAEMYGFTVTKSAPCGAARVHDFFEDFLVRALLWAFNPGPPTRRGSRMDRVDLWIERNRLIAMYLNRSLVGKPLVSRSG